MVIAVMLVIREIMMAAKVFATTAAKTVVVVVVVAIVITLVYRIKPELPMPAFRLPGYRKLQLRLRHPLCPQAVDPQMSTHRLLHHLYYRLSVSLDYDGERHDAATEF